MSFTFHCPFCNQELEAEENWIGQEAACPNCSKTIKIIKNSENSVQNLHSDEISCPHCGATIKKAAKLCRFCHRELHHAVGGGATYNQPILSMCKECGSFIKTTSSRIGQSMACPMCGEDMVIEKAENRTCPSCGESIKIEAEICKFCHSQLPPINAIGDEPNSLANPKNDDKETVDNKTPEKALKVSKWSKYLGILGWPIVHFICGLVLGWNYDMDRMEAMLFKGMFLWLSIFCVLGSIITGAIALKKNTVEAQKYNLSYSKTLTFKNVRIGLVCSIIGIIMICRGFLRM